MNHKYFNDSTVTDNIDRTDYYSNLNINSIYYYFNEEIDDEDSEGCWGRNRIVNFIK